MIDLLLTIVLCIFIGSLIVFLVLASVYILDDLKKQEEKEEAWRSHNERR